MFQKGESGNPTERPVNHHSPDNRIKKAIPQILDNLVDKALAGDPIAGATAINDQLCKESK